MASAASRIPGDLFPFSSLQIPVFRLLSSANPAWAPRSSATPQWPGPFEPGAASWCGCCWRPLLRVHGEDGLASDLAGFQGAVRSAGTNPGTICFCWLGERAEKRGEAFEGVEGVCEAREMSA